MGISFEQHLVLKRSKRTHTPTPHASEKNAYHSELSVQVYDFTRLLLFVLYRQLAKTQEFSVCTLCPKLLQKKKLSHFIVIFISSFSHSHPLSISPILATLKLKTARYEK